MVKRRPKTRAGLPKRERYLRSRLLKILSNPEAGFLQASYGVRDAACGQSYCRCHAGGPLHTLRVVNARFDKKAHQTTIPESMEPMALEWIARHREIQELLAELTKVHWEKLREKKKQPPL